MLRDVASVAFCYLICCWENPMLQKLEPYANARTRFYIGIGSDFLMSRSFTGDEHISIA